VLFPGFEGPQITTPVFPDDSLHLCQVTNVLPGGRADSVLQLDKSGKILLRILTLKNDGQQIFNFAKVRFLIRI
jgi:hypothetical protein